jgi:hypothetical protein
VADTLLQRDFKQLDVKEDNRCNESTELNRMESNKNEQPKSLSSFPLSIFQRFEIRFKKDAGRDTF